MADSASELDLESDTSSIDGVKEALTTNLQMLRRIESLQQENRVLKTEVETLKLKIKGLNELNQELRRNSVNIAKAEQEEEYISNILLKKITELKKEKESLALNYEQEEEFLTNELNRKYTQLKQEKVALEKTLAREQENQVSKLMTRIGKLEADMIHKQNCLDKLHREKIELENALEQEQEALVNKLWKKMEKLEAEKKMLQEKLESVGAPLPVLSDSQLTQNAGLQVASGPNLQRSANITSGCLRGSFKQTQSNPACTPKTPIPSVVATNVLGKMSRSVTDESKSDFAVSDNKSTENESMPATSTTKCILLSQSPMDIDTSDLNIHNTHTTSINSSTPSPHPVRFALNHCSDFARSSQASESASYVDQLREEVGRLRQQLSHYEVESATKLPQIENEERTIAEENRRLRNLLRLEKERREALCKQLSESESSLEMEDERQFNEASRSTRFRTTSDVTQQFQPVWSQKASPSSMLYGPGHAFATAVGVASPHTSQARVIRECGHSLSSNTSDSAPSSGRRHTDTFVSSNYPRSTMGRSCSPVTKFGQSEQFAKPSHPSAFNSNSMTLDVAYSRDTDEEEDENDPRSATPPSCQSNKNNCST